MLEIKGLVEVRRGARIYVLDSARIITRWKALTSISTVMTPGPFELLQARAVAGRSNITLNLPLCRPPANIIKMRRALQLEGESSPQRAGRLRSGDMRFHLAVAEATHNSMLVNLFRQSAVA